MLVRDIMQADVITATPRTTVAEALRVLRARGIRHLVVVEDALLAGIISDRDLKASLADDQRGRQQLQDIMTRAVVTIEPTAPVEDAARLMLVERISALPVIDAGDLIGLVTETDIVRLFVRALGAGEPSSRLDISLGSDAAALPDIIATIHAAGVRVSSVVTLLGPGGLRDAVIRVGTIDPSPVIRALVERGYPITTAWRDAAGATPPHLPAGAAPGSRSMRCK